MKKCYKLIYDINMANPDRSDAKMLPIIFAKLQQNTRGLESEKTVLSRSISPFTKYRKIKLRYTYIKSCQQDYNLVSYLLREFNLSTLFYLR